jgi:hypothetical protein
MNELSGASGGGLSTTVQPAASAGAVFHAASVTGAFHGVIAATTPTGSGALAQDHRGLGERGGRSAGDIRGHGP